MSREKGKKVNHGNPHREYLGSATHVNLDGKGEYEYLTKEESREESKAKSPSKAK